MLNSPQEVEKVPTIDDVVRISGVSRSTVFRFLNGSKVRTEAREAIQTAMKEVNYFYNPRPPRSDLLLVVSVREHFEGANAYGEMVSGVMNRAASLGLHVKLHADHGPILPPGKKRTNLSTRVGVIFIGKNEKEEDAESAELRRLGIPHVFVNRVFTDSDRSFVSVDLRNAAREAVDHLISLGHTDIATWGRPIDYRLDRDKMNGFRDAFAARGLPVPASLYTFEKDGDLEDIARTLFSSDSRPHAWFGLSDTHLMRLGTVVREFGLKVPEDIALVGMDDLEASKFFSPPLTSVRIPFREAGSTAVDVLLRLLENPNEAAIHVFLKHELVIRESCGATRSDHA